MRKREVCLFAGIILFAGFFLGGIADSGDKRIVIENEKVSVIHPEGWERGVPGKGYSLLFGKVEPNTKFRSNISLMITNIPGISSQKFTLNDLFNVVKSNLDNDFKSGYSNLKKTSIAWNGKEFLAICYEINRPETTFACKQYYIFHKDYRYLFTGISTMKGRMENEADYDRIVQSLQIKSD